MKLRIAHFCMNCDEEVILTKDTVYKKCPHCGYHNAWGLASIYEWKVSVDYGNQGIGI